jgi:hypothetical protein
MRVRANFLTEFFNIWVFIFSVKEAYVYGSQENLDRKLYILLQLNINHRGGAMYRANVTSRCQDVVYVEKLA